jgi:hypothetical protein
MSKLQVKVQNNKVEFFDSENESFNKCTISFQRTLRIPDDGKIYPLPPSLGTFPVMRVDDYLDKVPEEWKSHGGIFLPMYQREAMWLKFDLANKDAPKAIKIAVGKVNAITGETWNNSLSKQDYVIAGQQPWLDGINGGDGMIKQFVAMPLGGGYTVEAQVTGEEKFGGLQIMTFESKVKPKKPQQPVYHPSLRSQPQPYQPQQPIFPQPIFQPTPPPMQPYYVPHTPQVLFGTVPAYNAPLPRGSSGAPPTQMMQQQFAPMKRSSKNNNYHTPPVQESMVSMVNAFSYPQQQSLHMDSLDDFIQDAPPVPDVNAERERSVQSEAREMGLSAGGKMKQKIVEDPFGVNHWDTQCFGRCYVHIVNSAMFEQITGKKPPSTPISAKTYSSYGYPWFDMYEENISGVKGSNILNNVKSVKEIDQEKFLFPQQDDSTVSISSNQVKSFKYDKNVVRDGDW